MLSIYSVEYLKESILRLVHIKVFLQTLNQNRVHFSALNFAFLLFQLALQPFKEVQKLLD